MASDFDSNVDEAKGALEDKAGRLKDQATKYGQKAVDAVDAGRTAAASRLDDAAKGLRDKAGDIPDGRVSGAARKTADTFGATADYLRDHEVKDMGGALDRYVRANPVQVILGAAILGYFAGRVARS